MAESSLPKAGIYCIRCVANGRRYVGSSINIRNRWRSHRAALHAGEHPGKAFQASWFKHGEGAFEFSILELIDDPQNLIAAEQRWIDELNATSPHSGFNVSPTAGNCLGVRHSDETKAKQSAAHKGVPKSAEHRKAIGDAHRGRTRTQEERAKVSAGLRRYFAQHPEGRERMRQSGLRNGRGNREGRPMSAETRQLMSEQRQNDPRYRANALANLAKINSKNEQS